MDLKRSLAGARQYSRGGVSFVGALLKHSLVPLPLLRRVLPERGLVLDLGCGEGMLGRLVAVALPGLRLHGVDLDAGKIAIASRCAPANATFRQGEILECSAGDATAVLLNDVLHHHSPERQVQLLQKAASLLDPDGVLVLKEVDADDRLDRAMTGFFDGRLYPADQLNFRTRPQWREVLYDCGFRVSEIHRVRHPWVASRTVLVCRKRRPRRPRGAELGDSRSARVLVTGGTGFVGRHLVQHLMEHGLGGARCEVTVLCRDRTRVPAEIEGCSLLLGNLESLSDPEAVRGYEYVFHLAADKDFFGGKEVFANNVNGTRTLIEALRGSTDLKRLVFASSMGAVDRAPGDRCLTPMDEDSPLCPTSAYGKAKAQCERMIRESGLPFVVLRLPWCYGPGMTSATHVRALAEMVQRRSIITRFHWPGRVSVIDVRECARAFEHLAHEERASDGTFFVADPEPVALGTLMADLGRALGVRAARVPLPRFAVATARRVRRFLPLTFKSLFMDVLWVRDERLRQMGFAAAGRRSPYYVLPLLRSIALERRPSIHRSCACITGAASGIGHALSLQLSAAGRSVLLVDRDPAIHSISDHLPGSVSLQADLAHSEDVAALVDRVGGGAANWVINCAGIGARGAVADLSFHSMSEMIAVNLQTPTRMAAAAMQSFHRAGEGVVVNIASSAAFQPLPGMAVYGATKAYLLSFSEALSCEASTSAIRVITVCPSGVDTRFQETAGVRKRTSEPLLSPEQVASSILQMADGGRSGTLLVGSRARQMAWLARLLPRSLNVRLWAWLMKALR
jgi:short-subunit dehydrogenase/uncharacterized protein YbjT (DUF2867 family)/SAM-dependent methyltransferase